MSCKRSNVEARVCVLVSFLVLSATALTATPALALPEGRVYEQVSPVYKGGLGVGNLGGVSADGEKAVFDSLGVFAGVQWDFLTNNYLAERANGAGWSSSSLQPPPTGAPSSFSDGLKYALATHFPGQTKREGPAESSEYILHRVDLPNVPANWERFGPALARVDGKPYEGLGVGRSGDMCHKVLGDTEPLLTETETKGTQGQIYDDSRGCGGTEPYLRPVALDNAGKVMNPHCRVTLGVEGIYIETPAQGHEQESQFNAINSDGSSIFFTTSVEQNTLCHAHQLFARLGAARTLELSKPLGETCADVPCPGALARPSAYFKGASEDGSLVYFTTPAPLVAGDEDSGSDLYLAKIGCGEAETACAPAQRRVVAMTQVSHGPVAGQPADVQGVVQIAPDGSHVYFVANGILSEGPNAENHTPVTGADNLYVYDAQTGATVFIADLCSGPALSGTVKDAACPSDLGVGEGDNIRNDETLWGIRGGAVHARRARSRFQQLRPAEPGRR